MRDGAGAPDGCGDEEENPELVDMRRRFWISVALTVPLVVIAMGEHLPGHPLARIATTETLGWLQLLLATPVVLWGGWPFLVRGWQSVVHRSLNMFTLIGLGVGRGVSCTAWSQSCIPEILPTFAPRCIAARSPSTFEAAAAIVTLVLFGQVQELKARIENMGIDPGELAGKAEALRKEGQTVMFVAVDGKAAGLLGVADPVKGSTPEAIRQLHEEGIRIVMLTGDSRTTAEAVAGKLGIDEVMAEVLPDQKADAVKRLQGEGRIVAMAGDGINDAPALAQAQVGIAMGTGTDVAMESAGVTLVKGDLRGIVRARKLEPGDHAEHQAEPVLRLRIQRIGSSRRGGRPLPVFRHPAKSRHRSGGDEFQFRLRGRQRVEASAGKAGAAGSRRGSTRCKGILFRRLKNILQSRTFNTADLRFFSVQ